MSIFRHKTKHLTFKLLVPIAFILNIVIVLLTLHHIGIIFFWEFLCYVHPAAVVVF